MKVIDALSYEPTELGFGTSGLRGLVKDMTDLECYINVSGFLEFLRQTDNLQPDEPIYVGGDLRDSTPHIMQVVFACCYAAGLKPINCGKVPTPTAAYYALYQDAPCIVVTGSHIPSDRNGIKFYKREGEVLKEDEPAIQAAVGRIRNELYQQEATQSAFDTAGTMKDLPELTEVLGAVEETYEQRYVDIFASNCLAGKKVVAYQHSAVGRDLMVRLLETLGAETIAVERSDVFMPIDTENVTRQDQERFIRFATEYPDTFAIVSTDGDSDRPFVVDENGIFYRGDILGGVVAEFLGAKFAAVPISSNDAVDIFCQEKGIEIVHTKIGSPYVISAMNQAPAGKQPVVSWEVNGGFLTGSDITINGNILKPLPTRDAILPILCALVAATQKGQKISELFNELPHRYTAGSLIDNVLPAKIEQFKQDCKDQAKITTSMQHIFGASDLGELERTDLTDGLRLIFKSGDILHMRPSGNAPQFRVYTNASSQEGADKLAEDAVRKNGYIEQLLQAL